MREGLDLGARRSRRLRAAACDRNSGRAIRKAARGNHVAAFGKRDRESRVKYVAGRSRIHSVHSRCGQRVLFVAVAERTALVAELDDDSARSELLQFLPDDERVRKIHSARRQPHENRGF